MNIATRNDALSEKVVDADLIEDRIMQQRRKMGEMMQIK